MRLDDSQKAAVADQTYPHFLMAWAGSGKTTVLLAKAKEILKQFPGSGEIILLCFSRPICDEITTKLREQGLDRQGVRAYTTTSLGLRFVRERYQDELEKKLSFDGSAFKFFLAGNKEFGFEGVAPYFYRENDILDYPKLKRKCKVHISKIEEAAERLFKNFDPQTYRQSMYWRMILEYSKEILSELVSRKITDELLKFHTEDFAERYITKCRQNASAVNLSKFLNYDLYSPKAFMQYCHNTMIHYAFNKEFYNEFAQVKLDGPPADLPRCLLLAKGVTPELWKQMTTYEEADGVLRDDGYQLYAQHFFNSDFCNYLKAKLKERVTNWGEIDFDSMRSFGYLASKQANVEIKAILVDETQDLSPEEWYLTTTHLPSLFMEEPRVFFVGDASQSIYRWRNASPRRFLYLASYNHYSFINYCYRCPREITRRAQILADMNPDLHLIAKKDERPFISRASHQPGRYESALIRSPWEFEGMLNELGVDLSDVCILSRTNSNLAIWQLWLLLTQTPVQEIFTSNGPHFSSEENLRLLLVLTFLGTVSTTGLTVPASMVKQAETWLTQCIVNKEVDKPHEFLENFAEALNTKTKKALPAFLYRICHYILSGGKAHDDSDENVEKELKSGSATVTVLMSWFENNKMDITSKFVEKILEGSLSYKKSRKGLTVSTIHRFKGKEKAVIVLSCGPWEFILTNCRSDENRLVAYQEELALMYVAITRAEERVILLVDAEKGVNLSSPPVELMDLLFLPDDEKNKESNVIYIEDRK